MHETLEAQALLLKLNQVELVALRSLAIEESIRDLAMRLSIAEADALGIKNSMMSKIGVQRDADAVRVAILAGLGEDAR